MHALFVWFTQVWTLIRYAELEQSSTVSEEHMELFPTVVRYARKVKIIQTYYVREPISKQKLIEHDLCA